MEIHPVNGIYVFAFAGLITIDASQLCFEPLVVNNQDNFEFQFSATQIQVKWSRHEVLPLLSLYRDTIQRQRATVQGYIGKQDLKTFKFKKQNYTKTVDHNNVLANDKRVARNSWRDTVRETRRRFF